MPLCDRYCVPFVYTSSAQTLTGRFSFKFFRRLFSPSRWMWWCSWWAAHSHCRPKPYKCILSAGRRTLKITEFRSVVQRANTNACVCCVQLLARSDFYVRYAKVRQKMNGGDAADAFRNLTNFHFTFGREFQFFADFTLFRSLQFSFHEPYGHLCVSDAAADILEMIYAKQMDKICDAKI